MIKLAHVNKGNAGYVNAIKVYCGRGDRNHVPSPLGNEFRRADFGGYPGCTLGAYKVWLWGRMNDGISTELKMLRRLAKLHKDNRRVVLLQCHCANTTTCHCNVIKAAIEWVATHKTDEELIPLF